MRKLLALAGLVGALLIALVLPASGGAARIVSHFHGTFSDAFPDNLCGIDGTSVLNGMDDIQVFADNTMKDEFLFKQVFTAAASGKSVRIFAATQISNLVNPIDNGDGTITFITTFKGLPEKLVIPNGPVLSRDAGVVTFATTFFVNPDGSLTFVSQTFSGEKGPHPDLDSGFALFCDVIVPALT
jgi:hypothetical protein